jgi:GTPase SAR1 family protein
VVTIINIQDIISLTSLGIATLILVVLSVRIKNLSIQLSAEPKPIPTFREPPTDISSAIIELMDLRLKREALSHMIARAYELTSKGELSEDIKDMIVSKASDELRKVEERIGILEKYEELDRLMREKEDIERSFREKLEDISSKIEKLREALALTVVEPVEKKKVKVEKPEKPKVKRERKPRKPRELDELMQELEKILREEEE